MNKEFNEGVYIANTSLPIIASNFLPIGVANVLPITNLPMALENLPIAANSLPLVPISNDIWVYVYYIIVK